MPTCPVPAQKLVGQVIKSFIMNKIENHCCYITYSKRLILYYSNRRICTYFFTRKFNNKAKQFYYIRVWHAMMQCICTWILCYKARWHIEIENIWIKEYFSFCWWMVIKISMRKKCCVQEWHIGTRTKEWRIYHLKSYCLTILFYFKWKSFFLSLCKL